MIRLGLFGWCLSFLIGATAASAQGLPPLSWYAKGFGGATWPSGEVVGLAGSYISGGSGLIVDDSEFDLDYDVGYTVGASVGAVFASKFAVELEYAFRRADVSTTWLIGDDRIELRDSNDARSSSLMVNAFYIFDGVGENGRWRPYVGGGVGGADVALDVGGFGDDDWTTDTVLAYQAIAGIGYMLTPKLSLLTEARWFATEQSAFDGYFLSDETFDASFQTFDLLLGVSYAF